MSVALDPEAPEFIPKDMLDKIKDGLYTMNRAAKLSNTMPIGIVFKKFKSIPDFNVVAQQLNGNVVCQLNSIFKTEITSYTLKENDVEYNMEKITDANDFILDRIYHNIGCFKKGMTSSDLPPRDRAPGDGDTFNAPIVTKIQMGTATFTLAKNITRPQIMFKDTVDNTAAIWVPKIQEKPNNIKPLALEFQYNKEGYVVGFEHPYEVELSQFQPLPEWLVPDTGEPAFPPPLCETKYTYITTADQINELVSHLETVEEMAIDLEHHSYRSYQGFTCLMQMTTSAGDFIIDALATREHLHKLNLIFTNPKKLKIFHGADSDVVWLQRDFGVYIVGMFDTHQAARLLKHTSKSLRALLKRYCNIDADKTYQLADWRLRPLTDEMVRYARTDTHYLSYIWRRMKSDLLQVTGGQPDMLLAAFETSRQVCGLTYRKQTLTVDSHLSLYYCNKKSFNCRQMAALQMMFKWRDEQARVLDESTMYLLPNHMLLALAEKLPREVQGVSAICTPMPPFVKQNLVTIHKMLLSCRELSTDYQHTVAPVGPAYLERPLPEYEVHDMDIDEIEKDASTNGAGSALTELMSVVFLDSQAKDANNSVEEHAKPDLKLYTCNKDETNASKSDWTRYVFLPPYERYKTYCILKQNEDMRDYKEREAKVKALSRGNELIKTEVLLKMQASQPQGLNEKQGGTTALVETPLHGNEASMSGVQNTEIVAKHAERRLVKQKNVSAQNINLLLNRVSKTKKRGLDTTSDNDGDNDPPKNAVRRYDYSNPKYTKYRKINKSTNKKHKK